MKLSYICSRYKSWLHACLVIVVHCDDVTGRHVSFGSTWSSVSIFSWWGIRSTISLRKTWKWMIYFFPLSPIISPKYSEKRCPVQMGILFNLIDDVILELIQGIVRKKIVSVKIIARFCWENFPAKQIRIVSLSIWTMAGDLDRI